MVFTQVTMTFSTLACLLTYANSGSHECLNQIHFDLFAEIFQRMCEKLDLRINRMIWFVLGALNLSGDQTLTSQTELILCN